MLASVAILSAACVAQPATVAGVDVPLLAEPQPPGLLVGPGIEGALAPTECTKDAPNGVDTHFEPRKSSLRPPDPMPDPDTMPASSAIGRIMRRGYLVAGVSQNLKRFGSINPHNGEWEGFDIDIVREIALELFGDRNMVRFRAVNFSNQFEVLHHPDENKKVDILANTITITCERRYGRHVLFTTVYFDAAQRVVVPKRSGYQRLEDLAGQKVCASNRTTSMGKILATKDLIPVAVAEDTDCLALLQQGRVAAISTDDSILLGMIDQDPTIEMVGPGFSDEPYGLAIKETDQDFVRFVNGVLERVRKDGTWRRLYQQWLVRPGQEIPDPPAAEYPD